jgi:hypothetical protein
MQHVDDFSRPLGGWLSGWLWNAVVSWSPVAKNLVFAGPASGSNAVPTFRAVVAADLLTLDAFTAPVGDVSFNSHKATNVLDPTAAQDAATKNYVDNAVQALAPKNDVAAATTTGLAAYTYNNVATPPSGVGATITLTVAAVLVLDGYTPALNDRLLIKNETAGNAPYNGIYSLTTIGVLGVTQAVLTRTTDFDQPGDGINGAVVAVLNGTVNAHTLWMCTVAGSITFGTSNITFSQFTGTTYTADGTTLTLTGTTFSIYASYVGQTSITTLGTIATGTWNATTIAIAHGGTSVTSVTTAPTASAWAGWDANSNLSANSMIEGYATTATAAATTTLTVGSAQKQFFTGSTTQNCKLPVSSTMAQGQTFTIVNLSSGVVTIQSSGANTVQAMAANSICVVTCTGTGHTTAADWTVQYGLLTAGSGTVTSIATAGLASGGTITSTGTITVTAAVKSDQTTGTSTSVAVVPNVQQNHASACKAWVRFNMIADTVQDSYNVTSITDNGVGKFTVNITTAFADANYCCVGQATSAGGQTNIFNAPYSSAFTTSAATGCVIAASGSAFEDCDNVHCAFFGPQ